MLGMGIAIITNLAPEAARQCYAAAKVNSKSCAAPAHGQNNLRKQSL